MFDGEAFGAEIVAQVKGYLERETSALRAEIVTLRGEVETLKSQTAPESVKAAFAEVVAALPLPEPGKDGVNGKDADPEVIRSMVAEAVAALPAPENGKNGADGIDGKDGASVAPEDLTPIIEGAVERAIAAIPAPQNGADGRDGVDGKDGTDGRDGEKGADGADGVGLAAALIDKDGRFVVTLTDGTLRELGVIRDGKDGRDGEKGEPGRDAVALTGFDTALSEDGRTLTLSLENDDVRVTHELQLPLMIYRGVFKDGQTYLQGDTVTFGGSLWHCNAETTEKPLEGRGAWQLATRKGRDGKDGKP